jgi:hypothetical protein
VRLGTCVALEAVVGIAVLGGAAAGAWYGLGEARDYVASLRPAEAQAASLRSGPLITPLEAELRPSATSQTPTPAPAPTLAADGDGKTVFPGTDEELLAPLREGPVIGTKLNRGGSSLSLRIDVDGGRAAFKPEQTWPQSKPRRELAASRMDRFLHLGRVPPVIGRSFDVDELVAGFPPDVRRHGARRIDTEGLPRRIGQLAGSMSWWIPEIDVARIDGYDVDGDDGVVTWRRLVKVGAVIPDDKRWLAEGLSTMALFDFVIDNIDRWTGGNVRIAPGGRELFFMDNTMSFTTDRFGHRKGQLYLQRVQVFSRDLVTRLRAMTEDDIRTMMEPDRGPFEFLLTDPEIRATLARRDWAIAYIDRLISRHGEAAVLAFP